ncbi:MAG: GAF domain-containing protein [Bradyrhizobium sp.]
MSTDEMNVARYIRERSEELKRLSNDARLDLLAQIFGVAALEATKHEGNMLPQAIPQRGESGVQVATKEGEREHHRAALQDVLEGLVSVAESRSTGARAAFYIADDTGTGLHRVAGMSTAYAAYTAGFKVSPQSLACGLAAAVRRPVITPDVTKDPSWGQWRWLASAFNYRGCWSFPIEGRGGKVFGTFSLYFTNPSSASDRDIEFASVLTDTAAEIMARRRI